MFAPVELLNLSRVYESYQANVLIQDSYLDAYEAIWQLTERVHGCMAVSWLHARLSGS